MSPLLKKNHPSQRVCSETSRHRNRFPCRDTGRKKIKKRAKREEIASREAMVGATMDAAIYNRLPPAARSLVDQIESKSGMEIQVKSKLERPRADIVARPLGEEVVGVVIGGGEIVIESPTTIDAITEEAFVHELLHLERVFITNTFHVYPKTTLAKNGSDASNVENWLEHVIIYEQQIALCPNYQNKMDAGLVIFWDQAPWNLSGISLKLNLITRYMITHRYGLEGSKAAMARALKRHPPNFSARNAARKCLSMKDDKRAFVVEFLKQCGIPRDYFLFRRYNPEKRTFDVGPI